MKLAIQKSKNSFSERWIAYCDERHIPYKTVDCYKSDIIGQLEDCDGLMWHFSQNDPKAILFARQLIYSVEAAGKKVFPDFHTAWHFDDKVGQKYLLEAMNAPLAPTYIFFNRQEALEWAKKTDFPEVFKLRGGAGSQNVRLVKNRRAAIRLIKKAFNNGFPGYDPMGSLKERWRKYNLGKTGPGDIIKGIVRLAFPPPYSRVRGREKGYIYFQQYIPGNDHDIRVIVIGERAFAIKRMVRDNDFRASGSGNILYGRSIIDEATIRLSFDLAERLKSQCIAFDFIHQDGKPMLVEISYGFSAEAYDPCPGYWDIDSNWHEGQFNPYGWMVENLIKAIETNSREK